MGLFQVDVRTGLLRNGKTGAIVTPPTSQPGGQGLADWAENGIKDLEVLMIYDELLDVQGEDLAFAASTFDQNGAPAVAFTLQVRVSSSP